MLPTGHLTLTSDEESVVQTKELHDEKHSNGEDVKRVQTE